MAGWVLRSNGAKPVTLRLSRGAVKTLGRTARAEATELTLAMDELDTARWYERAELLASPENEVFRLPRRDSIARRLLEDWLEG